MLALLLTALLATSADGLGGEPPPRRPIAMGRHRHIFVGKQLLAHTVNVSLALHPPHVEPGRVIQAAGFAPLLEHRDFYPTSRTRPPEAALHGGNRCEKTGRENRYVFLMQLRANREATS